MDARLKDLMDWFATSGWRIVVIVILLFAGLQAGRFLIRRTLELALRYSGSDPLRLISIEKRRKTLVQLSTGILYVVLIVVAALMVFRELRFDIVPILASAGVAGIAIGFGAQSLVRDIIAGSFIILENQFDVGDVIRAAGVDGLVEQINLRTTILRDLSGTVHVIPNGEIKVVSVLTKDWSRLVLDVDVAYGEDLDRVQKTLENVLSEYAQNNPATVIAPPEILGVERLGESGITFRALVKTTPNQHWDAGRKLRKLIRTEFDRLGVKIPFPQRTVWMHSPPEQSNNPG